MTGGKHKGRILYSPKNEKVRPTSDKVRESVFNILNIFEGCTFFDLFAGAGSVGLEAWSRGAKTVILIDSDIQLCRKNVQIFQNPSLKVIKGQLPHILKRVKGQGDFIFMDPPFTHPELTEKTLEMLALYPHLYAKDAIFIVQQSQFYKTIERNGYCLIKEKVYGLNRLLFYKRNSV
ncbi:MAG: 16S rRNA (guanine(966)-N(2))-methyltransferase RsmD [Deltaproteobacteria bacterium]|nr:16S rRNA (guanine(966)-N(2))-methyltransferase RsmD [Deltaproteobacteria bacterium]